jgi:hypothetical protein
MKRGGQQYGTLFTTVNKEVGTNTPFTTGNVKRWALILPTPLLVRNVKRWALILTSQLLVRHAKRWALTLPTPL